MGNTVHAFGDDALGNLDAVGLTAAIVAGELGIDEVRAAAIARAEKVAPTLNAMVTTCYDSDVPRTGRFAGLPTVIKDNNDLRGYPTRQGCEIIKAAPAKKDGPVASALRDMGMSVLGKSSMPEFGLNASTEHMTLPPTVNPWDTAYSAGASSGGSAALVAAGVVPLAHANDGGGSIRIPAAACGLVGLKPTRGRFVLARTERMLPVGIVSEGVLTRTVRDTAHFHAAAEAFQSKRLPPIGLVEGPGSRRLRVGVLTSSPFIESVDPAVAQTVQSVGRLLHGSGHTVEPLDRIDIDDRFEDDFLRYWAMLAFALKKSTPLVDGRTSDELDTLTIGLSKRFAQTFTKAPGSIRRLRRLRHDYARTFETFDVVISPVLARPTPKLGYLSPHVPADELIRRLVDYVSFTPIQNVSGAPAISLPMGRTNSGMPIGVMVSAAHGDERTLLEVAYELEAINPPAKISDPR